MTLNDTTIRLVYRNIIYKWSIFQYFPAKATSDDKRVPLFEPPFQMILIQIYPNYVLFTHMFSDMFPKKTGSKRFPHHPYPFFPPVFPRNPGKSMAITPGRWADSLNDLVGILFRGRQRPGAPGAGTGAQRLGGAKNAAMAMADGTMDAKTTAKMIKVL